MTNRRNTQSNVQSLARWALPLVATTLVACGGGEEAAGSTTQSSTPVVSIGSTTSPVTTRSLDYSVFSKASVATATAEVTSTDVEPIKIAFPVSVAFPTRLDIVGVNLSVPSWNGVPGNGIVPNMNWLSGAGGFTPKKGNFFVFCSAGRPSTSVSDAMAQAGAQVAISANFGVANLSSINGKAFYRFDCTNPSDPQQTTTNFGGVADVAAAFGPDGYQPNPGVNPTYKRRAYQVTLNGQPQYVVVALDTDDKNVSTASVLYQYN